MIKGNFGNKVTIITVILMVFSVACCFANELDFNPFGSGTWDANTSAELVKEGPIIPQVQFSNNDISMAFQIISDLTGWSIFPTAQTAKARISLWANNISAQELLDIVVNLAGFTYHKQGNIVTVMTYDEYIQFHGLAREIIELTYAEAASVASVIKPFMSKRGVNIVHSQTNTIVLYETVANFEFIVDIIERLDNPAEDIVIEVINLKYADSTILGGILGNIFTQKQKVVTNKTASSVPGGVTKDSADMIVPYEQVGIYALSHANQLVLVARKPDIERLKQIIDVIDVYRDNMVLEVIELKYADAQALAKTLQEIVAQDKQRDDTRITQVKTEPPPGKSPPPVEEGQLTTPLSQVRVFAIGRTNQIIIKAFRADVENLKNLVKKLDTFVEPVTKSYHFVYVDAVAIVRDLQRIFDVYGRYGRFGSRGTGQGMTGGSGTGSGITLIEKTNSILLTGPPSVHRIMASILESVDVPGTYEAGIIRIYKIENADVDEIAATIRELLLQTSDQTTETGRTKFDQGASTKASDTASGVTETEVFIPKVEARISINKATNSVVIQATAREHRELEKLIKELDIRRKQVLIEAMIIEVTTSDDFEFGVELNQRDGDILSFSSFGLSSIDPLSGARDIIVGAGASAAILTPGKLQVIVKALQSNANARIESAPQILVNNNAEGLILSIVEEPTTQTNLGETTTTTSFAGFVEAGTQFSITPHISEGDYLRIVYQITLNSFGNKTTDPSIPPPRNTSSIKSEATIPDGSTIVVGGLQTEHERKVVDKVPILGDIPLLGLLFQNTVIKKQYVTTYLFITAKIIKSEDFQDLKDLSKEALEQVSEDDTSGENTATETGQ